MAVCLVKDLIKGVIFELITNCTHGLLQVVVFFYAIVICKVGPVMYLGCDKDQWRWRFTCISYVVLRGVILEQ